MPLFHIKSDSEFKKYTKGSLLTVVDFTATWCGPCQMVAPRFEQLSKKHPSVNFLKVDVDECKDIASEHGVRAMPTFQFFKNGVKVNEVVGADIGKVESLVNTLSGSSSSSGPGYTLGKDGGAANSVVVPNLLAGLTPIQQQYLFMGGMLLLFWYLAK